MRKLFFLRMLALILCAAFVFGAVSCDNSNNKTEGSSAAGEAYESTSSQKSESEPNESSVESSVDLESTGGIESSFASDSDEEDSESSVLETLGTESETSAPTDTSVNTESVESESEADSETKVETDITNEPEITETESETTETESETTETETETTETESKTTETESETTETESETTETETETTETESETTETESETTETETETTETETETTETESETTETESETTETESETTETETETTETESETTETETETTETETETTETESETTETESETTETETETTETESETTETETETTETESKTTETESETTETEAETKPPEESSSIDDVDVVENNGEASVVTPSGIQYTVSGYNGIEKNGFSFVSGLTVDLSDAFSTPFNRFTLKYKSTAPLKIYISYVENGTMIEDYFFLEAGEGTFSAFVLGFLDKIQAKDLTSIRVDTCKNKNAEFVILDLTTAVVSVPNRDYYISGSRYTLGIDLGWGGTINYVSDNTCPISGVTNMINKHDPGRLVQQSYYGTGAIEGVFEWGSFNGSDTWPYNPVQGGGKGGYPSRIIDFVVDGNCVYIKAQPLDWGKINYITPSYMENWYIIEDDYIKVDNRFVDFSGWEHPCRGQEIPAFYTISYLDSFVWYDGVDSWTGDDLSWRHELNFWGDSQYSSECSFRIKVPNTETWCAWVSTEDNYGIGVYVPNADRYSAGRYQYNGSKDASANATNYVAPWKQIQLISYLPLEYSYLICAGSVEEIRSTFTEYKDLFDNASLSENSSSYRQPHFEVSLEEMDFTSESGIDFVLYPNNTNILFDEDEGAVKLVVKGSDPHVSFDYSASAVTMYAEDYAYVEIVYMIPTTNSKNSYSCQLFICADKRINAGESDSVRVNLIADGNYHMLRVKLSEKDFWKGTVNLIRFDYFDTSEKSDVMYIRSCKLTNGFDASFENIDFTDYLSIDNISAASRTEVVFDKEVGAAKLTVIGNDPSITIDYSVLATPMYAEDYKTLKITYMVPAGQSFANFSYAIFPCTGDLMNASSTATVYKPTGIIADGQVHVLEIDLSQQSFWAGKINKIRIDYFNNCSVGDIFYLMGVELVK